MSNGKDTDHYCPVLIHCLFLRSRHIVPVWYLFSTLLQTRGIDTSLVFFFLFSFWWRKKQLLAWFCCGFQLVFHQFPGYTHPLTVSSGRSGGSLSVHRAQVEPESGYKSSIIVVISSIRIITPARLLLRFPCAAR